MRKVIHNVSSLLFKSISTYNDYKDIDDTLADYSYITNMQLLDNIYIQFYLITIYQNANVNSFEHAIHLLTCNDVRLCLILEY